MGRRQAAPKFNEIPPSTQVIVRNLRSAAHQNGQQGKVVQYDRSKKRYVVKLQSGSTDTLALRPANILQIVRGARVTGIESKTELNGCTGAICGYDDGKGRYLIKLDSSRETTSMRPGNVVLPPGTRAVVVGLSKGAQHNGKWGEVKNFDAATGRYKFQIGPQGEQLSIKLDNVSLVATL